MPSVLVLAGDGIGPEVTASACAVLAHIRPDLAFTERHIGQAAIDRHGAPYEPDLLEYARGHDAILMGAVGGAEQRGPGAQRPEEALFALRGGLDLYANLRPIRAVPALLDRSPIRPECVEGTDFLLVRELTGGLYFGRREYGESGAFDTCTYSREQIERIVRTGFEAARSRRRRLASVDKANVLSTGALWRAVVTELSAEYADVEVEHLLVDNAAMQLLLRAPTFDVVVTENLFGDILSDEASLLAGGARDAALRLARCGRPGALRAGPRKRPRHRGPGDRQPMCRDPLRRDAAQARARRRDGRGRDRVGGRQRAGRRRRPRDLGGTATTDELTAAVIARL